MLLNAHPDMACPSVHQLYYFIKRVPQLLTEYNSQMVQLDQITARQGPSLFNGEDARTILRSAIITEVTASARDKPASYFAINDNTVISRFQMYSELFPEAKFLCIVRDPRDVVVSGWKHNLCVEEDFVSRAKDINT